MLNYKVEKKGNSLIVRLQQSGSKRVLYLDTLKAISQKSDQEAVSFLIKIHLKTTRNPETLTFDRIEVPPHLVKEAVRLMSQTNRMIGNLGEPKQNLEPLRLTPRLTLKDTSGSFANLSMDYGSTTIDFYDFSPLIDERPRLKKEEAEHEKDLLEAGYIKKIVGQTMYYCPLEKVRETLNLLLSVGWQIVDPHGRFVNNKIEIKEENGRVAIRGQMRAFLDHKLQMDGVWEQETLYLKKSQMGSLIHFLEESDIQWDETICRCVQGLKENGGIVPAPPGDGFRGKLLPYQEKGVEWLNFLYESQFSALLADEMGLGKTVQVLAFLSRLKPDLPVLVVAPTSLIFNWKMEIDRFLPNRFIEIISYTTLRLNDFSSKEYEVIVLDESNAIKTSHTQTARAAYQLKGKFKICMSGTPMENRLDEICSQFHFLMPGLIEKNVETLKRQLRPFILRRKKEQVQIDLPEKIEQITWVEMNEEQKKLYDEIKRNVRLEEKMAVLEAILRLRQVANDPRLIGHLAEGAKMERIIQDVSQALFENRKVLIFSGFTSMLKLIYEQFPQSYYLDGSVPAAKRGEIIQAFQNDSNASIFLLSIKAAGVGLNLNTADYVFIIDPWWNEAVERQAIDRAHRIGQKNTVIVKRYLSLDSIEEKMLNLKQEKLKIASQLLDQENSRLSLEDLINLLG